MKKIIVSLWIMINTGLLFAQPCSPTFKEIFDFHVGDYFKYEDEYSVIGYVNLKTNSYTITGRRERGDTLLYTIKGTFNTFQVNYRYGREDTLNYRTILIEDTLIYIDSVNHFLNKCAGTMYDDGALNEYCEKNSGRYTSVRIVEYNNMLLKTVGGWSLKNYLK
jgi:hypothetical protein